MKSRSNSPSARRRRAKEFGDQAALCRRTMCCACWAVKIIRSPAYSMLTSEWRPYVMRDYDWTQLPDADSGWPSDPHHEPPRGTMRRSDDDDTIPLCRAHHTGGWDVVRHRSGMADRAASANFFEFFCIDWQAVRDEMRRRVSENG